MATKKPSGENDVADVRSCKVLVMAGGTGGHVFPALTVADILRSRGHCVEWLGTKKGIEASLVPRVHIPLHLITIEGLRGKGSVALLKAPWLLLKALAQATRILRRVDPDVVLGFGGFVSGPGGLSAALLRKPLVIHEQNAVAGTTNKILSAVARCVLEAFPGSLPGARLVGNPVRPDIVNLPAPKQRYASRVGTLKLLVLGGSLGALAINQLLPQAVAAMDETERPEIWHQTGKAHLQNTVALYGQYGVKAKIEPFIDSMSVALAWADLVISRSGALTVAEIAAAGIAAVLVPFPHAIDDHQTENALWLVRRHAAILKSQQGLTAADIREVLQSLIHNRDQLCDMACRARRLAMPEAANQVVDICQEVANG